MRQSGGAAIDGHEPGVGIPELKGFVQVGKTRITIYLDDIVIERFKALSDPHPP